MPSRPASSPRPARSRRWSGHNEDKRRTWTFLIYRSSFPILACSGHAFDLACRPQSVTLRFMAIILGVDLGTTKITALALDVPSGKVLTCASAANHPETTSPRDKARGYSEWDVRRIADIACACLRQIAEQLAGQK